VSALRSQIFQRQYSLRLIQQMGWPVSSRTQFMFVREELGRLNSILARPHIEALQWFEEHAGQLVPWTTLNESEPKKAILPKGIYRPAGWRHALSVKVIVSERYADEEPPNEHGGRLIRYHQEEPKNADPARYHTNRGFLTA
jgi:hypothetical protein